MEFYKNSERNINARHIRKAFKATGYSVKEIGEYSKWQELRNGGKLQVTLTVYEIKSDNTCYLIADPLDRVAAPLIPSKSDVMDMLKKAGYKTIKKWYIEDYGMSEETWKAWNAGDEVEE